MNRMKSTAAALATGALLAWGQGVLAATYYVATTGSDSAAGSATSPFRTLQRGVSAAAAGDTIIVRDGTYGPTGGGGSMGVNILKSGTSSAWITLKAEHKGGAILDCQLTCHSYVNFGSGSGFWVLQDFDIRNGSVGGIWANNGGGKSIRILGNRIHHIGNYYTMTAGGLVGMYTDTAASNWIIDGNVFHDIGRDGGLPSANHDHGIYTHGANMRITNNVFYNARFGWHIQTVAGFSGTIANNTFMGPAGINKPGVDGLIVLYQTNSNVFIRNNVFYNPKTAALFSYNLSMSGACAFDNNVVYSASGSVGLITPSMPSACTASANLMNADPKLITPSATNWNFRLQSTSPAIDKGVAVAGVTADFDGAARPQGAAYDIGAFEYGGAAAPPSADGTPPVLSGTAVSAVGQTGATIGWTTNEPADTQVEYGPTTAYGASTALNAALVTSHSAVLSGLAAGTTYHYRVKSRDAAGNLATGPDATFTTAAPALPPGCIGSSGAWANLPFTPQTGAFTLEFDAVPGAANIDGVSGLAPAAAAGYDALAVTVRFNNAGTIDARNGGVYAAAAAIPYVAGLNYHFRLVVNIPARTYSAYVRQGSNAELLLGAGYAFRTEQAAATSLSAVGLYSSIGSQSVCAVAVAADVSAPGISAVAVSAVTQTGATVGWTTNEAADTQVEYGPTTAYGASSVLNSALATSHRAVLSGLSAGTLYHYRVKSKDAAGNLATSPDATFTTSAAALPAGCVSSAGAWANAPFSPQTGTFTAEFDAAPAAANMDGVLGLSNGPASGYGALAVTVRFNNAGMIDARSGGAYAAAAALPYVPGLTYHFRLVVSVPAHSFSAYVRQGTNAEQLIGSGYAFRTEQNAVGTLSGLGLYAATGGVTACAVTAAAAGPAPDTAAPVISSVAVSAVGPTGATVGWTTNEAADTQVEYGPTTAYGASTVLNSALATSHAAVLSGLSAGTLYHYRVKSKDAAGNLATSPDAAFTTSASALPAGCVSSAGDWANVPFAAQAGVFTLAFDAVPGAARIDGVSGASDGPASGYGSLAAAVRFNNAGMIDARNGGDYAAAAAIPYSAGLTYRVRLLINVPAHTFSAYVRQGSGAEQLIGSGYAFRTEQKNIATLNNAGLRSTSGSLSVCAVSAAAAADAAAPGISAVAVSAVTQTGATVGWTTNEPSDTQVEYGPTTAYGASTVLNAALSASHSAVLSGLTAGTLYHYRVKSRDAAGNLATSPDAAFTTAAAAPGGACINSSGAWANAPFAAQAGSFTVEFDGIPGGSHIDGVTGLSNGPASGYTALAAAVRFNNAGRIDAIDGAAKYAAAASIPYASGLTYRFRLVVNVPARTYSAYVRQGANAEQLIGSGYAFRAEQSAVAALNNLGLRASSGSQSVCGVVVR